MPTLAYFHQDTDGLLEVSEGNDLYRTIYKEVLARTLNLMYLSSRETFTINELLEELPIRFTRACLARLINNLVESGLVLRFFDTEADCKGVAYFYKINLQGF